jgi:hypothetical protein
MLDDPRFYIAWDKYIQHLCDLKGIIKTYKAPAIPQKHIIDPFKDENDSSQPIVSYTINQREENTVENKYIENTPSNIESSHNSNIVKKSPKSTTQNESPSPSFTDEKEKPIESKHSTKIPRIAPNKIPEEYSIKHLNQEFVTKKYFTANKTKIERLVNSYKEETGLAAFIIIRGELMVELKKANPLIDKRTHTLHLFTLEFTSYYHENMEESSSEEEF